MKTYKYFYYRIPADKPQPKKGPPQLGDVEAYFRHHPNFVPAPRGGATICVIVDVDGATKVGAAYCSLADQFSYRRGKDIARGRAEKTPYEGTWTFV